MNKPVFLNIGIELILCSRHFLLIENSVQEIPESPTEPRQTELVFIRRSSIQLLSLKIGVQRQLFFVFIYILKY